MNKKTEEIFVKEITILYRKWKEQAKSCVKREHRNIMLDHCEDLDEVMGNFFGCGSWQRGKPKGDKDNEQT